MNCVLTGSERMYYKKIELFSKDKTNPMTDDDKKLLWNFLFLLERNGQILKNYKVIQDARTNNFVLYVTAPKADSLEDKYDSPYVKQDRAKILDRFTLRAEDCGIDTESQSYCECEKRSAVEMQTFEYDIDSVFSCCDCGKPIALYELPHLNGCEDYDNIQGWQQNYSDMDRLWMGCLFDRYTGNQRVNAFSALNMQGRELAGEMSKLLGCPVYYHLADDYGKKVKFQMIDGKKIHICPQCGKVMERMAFSGNEMEVCVDCQLSFDVL